MWQEATREKDERMMTTITRREQEPNPLYLLLAVTVLLLSILAFRILI